MTSGEELTGEIGPYKIIRRIGSGKSSDVYLALHRQTGVSVAIKYIEKAGLTQEQAKVNLLREQSILSEIDHPLLIKCFDILEDDRGYGIVFEYAKNGTLSSLLNDHDRLTESQARRYLVQLIIALQYLHKKNICHRDFKADNILLDENNNIRIADFGLSREMTDSGLSSICGSLHYASPEMLKHQKYGLAIDIWGMGVIIYLMTVGKLPFDDASMPRLLRKISEEEVVFPMYISTTLRDLLRKMLIKDPRARITLDQVKEHPWFSTSEYSACRDFIDRLKKGKIDLDVGMEPGVAREIVKRAQLTKQFELATMGAFQLPIVAAAACAPTHLPSSERRRVTSALSMREEEVDLQKARKVKSLVPPKVIMRRHAAKITESC